MNITFESDEGLHSFSFELIFNILFHKKKTVVCRNGKHLSGPADVVLLQLQVVSKGSLNDLYMIGFFALFSLFTKNRPKINKKF